MIKQHTFTRDTTFSLNKELDKQLELFTERGAYIRKIHTFSGVDNATGLGMLYATITYEESEDAAYFKAKADKLNKDKQK